MNEVFQLKGESYYSLKYNLNLKFHLFALFIMVENLFHILVLKYGNLCHPLSGKLTLPGFKKSVKKCKPSNCPCRLCKSYLSQVGWFPKGCFPTA